MLDSAALAHSRPVSGRDCGECALCCKVYDVPEAQSTAGVWCRHCKPGRGCGIHETRPDVCRAFFCMWMTQDFLGPEWKPDRARFVLTMDPATNWLFAQVDPGAAGAWRKEPYLGQFRRWAQAGHRPVLVFVNRNVTAVLPDGEVALGILGPGERVVLKERPGGRIGVEKVAIPA